MQTLIAESFSHIDTISPHIAEGNFDIVGPNGDIIMPGVWDLAVQPGWIVELRIRSPTSALQSSTLLGGTQSVSSLGPAADKTRLRPGSAADDKNSSHSQRSRASIRSWLGRQKASRNGVAAVGG